MTSDPEPRLVSTVLGPVAVAEEGPPEAPPVLCVPGIPGTSRDFRYLGPLLAPALRVLRVEMPGFGRSPESDIRTVAGWARVLDALRRALALDRPLLLAHSFGGGACLLAAGGDPAAWRGLVLMASMGVNVHREMRWPAALYRALAVGLRFPLTRPLLLAGGRRAYRRGGFPVPSSWRELLLHVDLLASVNFVALAAAARAARLPAVVAWSLDDRITEPSVEEELAATLPCCTPLVFPSGGHFLQKHRAREVAEAVRERFGGIAAARGERGGRSGASDAREAVAGVEADACGPAPARRQQSGSSREGSGRRGRRPNVGARRRSASPNGP